MSDDLTDFGFSRIPVADKAKRVAGVFHSVAGKYDLMNDIMSLGTHRLMKRLAVEMTAVREGDTALDLAGGTGDFAALLSPLVGASGSVVLCDINYTMLARGRDRLIERGIVGNIDYVQGDAERLPFPDRSFSAVTIGFGLRNMTHKDVALASIHAALKPGGRLVILEFSHPRNPVLKSAYQAFSSAWPRIGKVVADDEDSYRYLIESIKMHPDQETLKSMMEDAGFVECRYHNLASGVAAIHTGIRN